MDYSKLSKDELIKELERLKKSSNESLKIREEKYESLTNNLNVGIYRNTGGAKGKFIEANPALIKMFGYIHKFEFLQLNVSDLYHYPKERAAFVKELIKNGFAKNREIELIKKDGSTFMASVSSVVVKDGNNGNQYYDGIVEDISERKAYENALIKSEENYRLLIENQTELLVKFDSVGRVLFASPSYCDYFNKMESELLNRTYSPQIHEEDRQETLKALNKIHEPPYNVYIEHRNMTKFGWRWIAWMNTAILDGDKRVKEIIWVGRDITEKKITEEALLQSEKSYRGLFDSATDAIYIQDKEGHFVDVNLGAVKMYGHPRDYFIGKPPEILSAPGRNDLEETGKKITNAFNGKPQAFEFWGIDKKGRVFPKEVKLNKGIYFGKEVIVAFARDITDRYTTLKNLEEKEKKFRSIYNAFPDIYFKSSIDGVVKEISPSVKSITGFSPGEVIGQHSSMFYFSKNEWDEIGSRLSNTLEVKDFDTQLKTKDNEIINCSLTAKIIVDQNNIPVEIEGVLRDITKRVKAENAVSESRRRLSTLMDNLPGMAYRCLNDDHWTMEFVSNGCKKLTGYKINELLKNRVKSYDEVIHEDDRPRVRKEVEASLQRNKSFRLKYRIVDKSGQVKWVWEQGTGVFDEQGKLVALEGFITDISEQVLAEKEISKLSRSVEQSPTIVLIADLNAKIEYANPRFTQVTGYTAKEVIGKNPRILKSGNTPDSVYKDLWTTITAGKDWTGELQNKKKNGELYWESANIFPLKGDNGDITHYIAMKEDITARKKMEQDLIDAKEKAEEADKLKSAFLANMSHEIRTPMNAIIGFSQLLDEIDIEESERSHYISLIQNSGNDLMNLIDDIIDISKIEVGQMKIFKSQYFINNLMEEIYDNYNEIIKSNPQKSDLVCKYVKPLGAEKILVNTDIDRFKQVFRNLINNAIKFTDSGSVQFGFTSCKSESHNYLQFYVKDTGIGISQEKLDVIFKSFTQANESDTRLYGGTGLGLSISKRIVELLGGEIWVKSTPGEGSTFYFTLPTVTSYQATESSSVKIKKIRSRIYNWKNKQILIVEDDIKSFTFIESILKKTGIDIDHASDGLSAIEMVNKKDYHLVLMDIQLPKLNGYKTTQRIKEIKPNIPIIAQTAYAMENEKQKCLEAGCDDYVSKPIKIDSFLQILESHLN